MKPILPVTEKPPNAFTLALGARVKTARQAAEITQTELAHQAFVHRNTISNMEAGKVEVSVSTLVMVARVLGRPLSYFIPVDVPDHQTDDDLESSVGQRSRYSDEDSMPVQERGLVLVETGDQAESEANPAMDQTLPDAVVNDYDDWKTKNTLLLAQVLAWIQNYSDSAREPTDEELSAARLSLRDKLSTSAPDGTVSVREPTVREIAEEWIRQNEEVS